MSRAEYIIGQIVVLKDLITDPANDDTAVDDPTDVATVYKPDGTTTAPLTVHGATNSGQYTAQITLDQTGWWVYVFNSTGAGAGAGRGRFYVSPVP